MEKTISINLSGQNFLIEEEAYNKLTNYLENIKKHCGAGADSIEVIADIENSMAEKLRSSLTPYKEVVTLANVDSLIKIMGTVEDFDREIGTTDSHDEAELPKQKIERKLYRDTDNVIIGGVAAGLGNYFDVDPVLIRVIFIALIFAGGSGVIIYILLWIAMPEAKTAYQKLEMQGQAPTLSAFKNLTKTGKQIQENWKKTWQKRSALGKIISLPLVILNGLIIFTKKIIKSIWPIIKFCFGLGLMFFSFIAFGVISVGSLFMLLYNNSSYQLSFIPIAELTSLLPYTWMVVAGFLSLIIPTLLIFIVGLSIIIKKNTTNIAISLALVGLWMVSVIFFCAMSLRYLPEIKNKFDTYPLISQTEQVIDLKDVTEIEASGNLVNILVSTSTSTPATLNGRIVDLNNIEINRIANKLIIKEKPIENNKICFECDLYSVELKIATSSNLKIVTSNGASINNEISE